MKCPSCNDRAISFFEWGQGHKWQRYQCPHCGAELKASARTYIYFFCTLALIPAFIYIGERIADSYHIDDPGTKRLIYGAVFIPVAMVIAFWNWRSGSYALRQRKPEK